MGQPLQRPQHPQLGHKPPDKVAAGVRQDLLDRAPDVEQYRRKLFETRQEHIARMRRAYQQALDLAHYLNWAIQVEAGEL